MKKLLLLLLLSSLMYAQRFSPSSLKSKLIKHKHYSIEYSEQNEQPYWVHYFLTKNTQLGKVKRNDKFRPDKSISTGSATLADYKSSGYDRGHLCPAQDMSFSKIAMSESFFMSNMSPQKPQFNRGIWKKLESFVRDISKSCDTLFISTGPIFRDTLRSIGKNKVTVPGYYYKALLLKSGDNYSAIGFVLPNDASKNPIEYFRRSINFIEEKTGIDFFAELPDNIEEVIEK